MNGLRTVRFRPHQLLLNESSLFKLMQERLKAALDEHFDDIELCKDIQEHGCASCAPSGFIYYYETRKFFNEYEEELEEYFYEIFGDDWMEQFVSSKNVTDTATFKNYCVWLMIELYCLDRVNQDIQGAEEASNAEWVNGKIISNN